MYASKQTTEVQRLAKKLEVAEASASQSDETVARLTNRVEQLQGILSKQLTGSIEDLMDSRAPDGPGLKSHHCRRSQTRRYSPPTAAMRVVQGAAIRRCAPRRAGRHRTRRSLSSMILRLLLQCTAGQLRRQ